MIAKVDPPFMRQIVKTERFFLGAAMSIKNVFNKQHGSEAASLAVRIPSVRVPIESIHVRFWNVHDS